MTEPTKNTKVKSPQKPSFVPPIKPQIPILNKFRGPNNFKGPNTFSQNAFRNQNRGSGGK